MNSTPRYTLSILSLVMFASISVCDAAVGHLGVSKLEASKAWRVLAQRAEGVVTSLRVTGQPISVSASSAGVGDEQRARAFVSEFRDSFVDADTPLELIALPASRHATDANSAQRLQQFFRGIPVRGAEAIVHLNAAGVVAAESKLLSGLSSLDIRPRISVGTALSTVRGLKIKPSGTSTLQYETPRLEIINVERLRGNTAGETRLAWLIEVTGGASELVWVDAANGRVLLQVSQIAHALSRSVIDIQGSCAETIVSQVDYTEGGTTPDVGSASADAVAAWNYAKVVYEYFITTFALDGVDGAGGNGTIEVNVCDSDFDLSRPSVPAPRAENALWNPKKYGPKTLLLGTGMALAEDIVAHEYTHALTYFAIPGSDGLPAGFLLTGQSGALAESFSDIFGEVIDRVPANSNDIGETAWAIGEAAPGGPFRNLMSPNLFGMPGKTTDTNFYCGSDDKVAIHVNSGVLSHAFALLADGGSYNGLAISGIGIEKAAKIFYAALTEHMTSSSSFLDAYNALLSAANGLEVISASDRSSLSKAIAAVELNVAPCSSKLDYCPAGSGAQTVFRDNFESINSGNWISAANEGVNHWNGGDGSNGVYRPGANDAGSIYVFEGGPVRANSGKYALWADTTRDGGAPNRWWGDSSTQMVNAVSLPATGDLRMQFEHYFDFEATIDPDPTLPIYDPDGGVLEYSIDGGSNWLDAKDFIKSGRGYSNVIQDDQAPPNPLAGRSAFTGLTGGYVSTQLDLSPLAGQSVQFRFRMGTDKFTYRFGWLIDDVAIYSCSPPGIVVSAAAGLQTSEDGAMATFNIKLAVAPTGFVALSLGTSNEGEGVVTPTTVVFTPENWNEYQQITVTGVSDGKRDGDQDYTVSIRVSDSKDTAGFASVSSATVTVTNLDNGRGSSSKGRGGGSIDALVFVLLLLLLRGMVWRRELL